MSESLKNKTQHFDSKGDWISWTTHGPFLDRRVWLSPDPMRSCICVACDSSRETEGLVYRELSVLRPITCIILCNL